MQLHMHAVKVIWDERDVPNPDHTTLVDGLKKVVQRYAA
jgi:hypothetical protein